MELTINGKPERLDDALRTVADLVRARHANATGACAVELDGRLAPRREWEATPLRPGAAVEIVTLVGGG